MANTTNAIIRWHRRLPFGGARHEVRREPLPVDPQYTIVRTGLTFKEAWRICQDLERAEKESQKNQQP